MEESGRGGSRAARESESAVLNRELNREVEGLPDGGV